MKLEFLPDGSADCPLLRLYDFTPSEARQFHDAIAGLASGSKDHVDVHDLCAVKPIGGCALTLVVSRWEGELDTVQLNEALGRQELTEAVV